MSDRYHDRAHLANLERLVSELALRVRQTEQRRVPGYETDLIDEAAGGGGRGGAGVPLYPTGKRFEEEVSGVGELTWTSDFPELPLEFTFPYPQNLLSPGPVVWIAYVSATFDLSILAVSDQNEGKLDFECKIEPDTVSPYVEVFAAPISRDTRRILLGQFADDTVHASIPYEWMMVCFLSDTSLPEDYAYDIPAVTNISLTPSASATLEVINGDPEATYIQDVDAKVVVHAINFLDPTLFLQPGTVPLYFPEGVEQIILGQTVDYGGGGGGGSWEFTGGPWATGTSGLFGDPGEYQIQVAGDATGTVVVPVEDTVSSSGSEVSFDVNGYLDGDGTERTVSVTVDWICRNGSGDALGGSTGFFIELVSDPGGSPSVLATGTDVDVATATTDDTGTLTLSGPVTLPASTPVAVRVHLQNVGTSPEFGMRMAFSDLTVSVS